VLGSPEDSVEVALAERVGHLDELVLHVGGPRLHHVARGGLAVRLFRLLIRWDVRGDDPEVLLGVEAVVAHAHVESVRTTVLVVESGVEPGVRACHRTGGRGGAATGDRGYLRERHVEPRGLHQGERGGREARRGGAEADVRREGVLAFQPDRGVDTGQFADVVDDHVDAFRGASVDLLVADDVGVLARVGLPLDGGRRRGRGGTEADTVVVRQSELLVAHPVVLDEPLDRVGSRGGLLGHTSGSVRRGLVVAMDGRERSGRDRRSGRVDARDPTPNSRLTRRFGVQLPYPSASIGPLNTRYRYVKYPSTRSSTGSPRTVTRFSASGETTAALSVSPVGG